MPSPTPHLRLLVETAAALMRGEVVVTWLLVPLFAPESQGILRGALHVVLLGVLVGPFVFWRTKLARPVPPGADSGDITRRARSTLLPVAATFVVGLILPVLGSN